MTKKPPKITKKQKQEQTRADAELPNFSETMLHLKLYPWQWRAMTDISKRFSRTAVRAANGSGKTRMISAPAALWNAIVNPGSTTVVTSGVRRQVEEQFWPALRELTKPMRAAMNVTVNKSDITIGFNGSRIVGFTAREGNLFEGFHTTGAHDSLMIILDEAKSIKPDIFRAVERCQPDRLLMVSSPGTREGCFYQAWSQGSRFWNLHVVTAFDCPHIRKEWIDMQIAMWPKGENDPYIRSMIFADWMDDDGDDIVIGHLLFEEAQADPPEHQGREKIAGCDFAAGGDENVIVVRTGNRIDEIIAWKEKDTSTAVKRFKAEFERLDLKPENIYADAGGVGAAFCDRLAEMGSPVVRVNFGGRSNEPDIYANKGTEMWFKTKHKFERRELIFPNDPDLARQMVTRRFRRQENTHKLILESKDVIRKRGGNSPDRGDAFVLCVAGDRWETQRGDVVTRPMLDEVLAGETEPELTGVYL